jgi:DNA-binding MarR family transcriptional regulator
MLVLWEQETTTVKALADALQLDYGTLSPLLKRLAAAGTSSVGAAPTTSDWSR